MLSAALLHDKLSYRSHVLWCKDLYSRGSRLVARAIRAGLDLCHSYQVTWLQDYTDQSEITAISVLRKVPREACLEIGQV
jgi:hypothetical protein